METCSVVMAVYQKDTSEWFEQAINSILGQTVKSDDIIVVCDGPIPKALDKVVKKYERRKEVLVVRLPKNVGAGRARNEGIKRAKNKLIAIMDADDIALPNRFELEIEQFNLDEGLTLVGGQIAEFENDDTENIVSYRVMPLSNEDIVRFARRRMPVNNPTIMFKKDVVLGCGGYGDVRRCQDYYMVAHLIAAGHKIENIPETVLLYRLDDSAIRRSKSWVHMKSSIATQMEVYKLGVGSVADLVLVSASKMVLFVLPTFAVKRIYRIFARKKAVA